MTKTCRSIARNILPFIWTKPPTMQSLSLTWQEVGQWNYPESCHLHNISSQSLYRSIYPSAQKTRFHFNFISPNPFDHDPPSLWFSQFPEQKIMMMMTTMMKLMMKRRSPCWNGWVHIAEIFCQLEKFLGSTSPHRGNIWRFLASTTFGNFWAPKYF